MAVPSTTPADSTHSAQPVPFRTSARPLDRRRLRLRHAANGTTSVNPLRDYRWSREQPIHIAELPATTQSYPGRGGLFQSKTGNAPPQPAARRAVAPGDGLVNVVGGHERAEKQQLQQRIAELENAQKVYKARIAEYDRQAESVKRKGQAVERQEQAVRKREAEIEAERSSLEKLKAQYKDEAKAAAKSDLETEMKKVLQQKCDLESWEDAVNATKAQVAEEKRKISITVERLKDKVLSERDEQWKLDRQDLKALQQELRNRNEEAVMQIKQDAYQRASRRQWEERKDYESYRKAWKDMSDSAIDLLPTLKFFMRYHQQVSEHWRTLQRSFKRPAGLAENYPDLSKRLDEHFQTKIERADEVVASLVLRRKQFSDVLRATTESGHTSRYLTRSLRLEPISNMYDMTQALWTAESASPVESYLLELEIDRRNEELADDTSVAEDHKSRIALQRIRHALWLNKSCVEVAAFRAILSETAFIKQLFLEDRERQLPFHDIGTLLRRIVRDHPDARKSEEMMKLQAEFSSARSEVLHTTALIAKRIIVEAHLNADTLDLKSIDANIQRRLGVQIGKRDSHASELGILSVVPGQKSLPGRRTSTRARVSQVPGEDQMKKLAIEQRSLEIIVRSLKRRPDFKTSQAIQKKYMEAYLSISRLQLKRLLMRRAELVAKHGRNHALVKKTDISIADCRTAIKIRKAAERAHERQIAGNEASDDGSASQEAPAETSVPAPTVKPSKSFSTTLTPSRRSLLAERRKRQTEESRSSSTTSATNPPNAVAAAEVKQLGVPHAAAYVSDSSASQDGQENLQTTEKTKSAAIPKPDDSDGQDTPKTWIPLFRPVSEVADKLAKKDRPPTSTVTPAREPVPEETNVSPKAKADKQAPSGRVQKRSASSRKPETPSAFKIRYNTPFGQKPEGTMNMQPTQPRQAVYMTTMAHHDEWQATPATGGFDLATVTQDFRHRFSDNLPQSHTSASARVADDSVLLEGNPDLSQLTLAESEDEDMSQDASSDGSYQPSPESRQESSLVENRAADHQTDNSGGSPGSADNSVPQLTYRISDSDRRRALIASPNSSAAYWTYRLYKNDKGATPLLHYCTTYEQTEREAKHFLNEPAVGFDLEWEMGAFPGKRSIKDCVSLIQIASESHIALFHLALFRGNRPEDLMPPTLRTILESRAIIKTGVNVAGDARRIEQCFGFEVRGCFELSHLYKVVKYSEKQPHLINRKMLNLAWQVQDVLLLPLKKDDVRISAWSKKLKGDQTEYAASDAYAGLRLFYALEEKRVMMNPMPPRPGFVEDKQPLVLGDGTVIMPSKSKIKPAGAGAKAAVAVEEEEGDEWFDALETLDGEEMNALQATAAGGSSSSDVVYPTLPSVEELSLTENRATSATPSTDIKPPAEADSSSSATSLAKTATKRSPPPPTPEIIRADAWVTMYRASHTKLKDGVGHATLRAYHLWHHQGFTCAEIANLLRDPPLEVRSSASYVLTALKEGLPYDVRRVKDAVAILPPSVQGRYTWIISKGQEER